MYWIQLIKEKWRWWRLTKALRRSAVELRSQNLLGDRVNIQVNEFKIGFSTNTPVRTQEDLGLALIEIGEMLKDVYEH